jgi:FHS family L-fucose permease-like MFS transporter
MAFSTANRTAVTMSGQTATDARAMAMITTLFFMWGFITCLNDILVPHLRSIFNLNYAEGMLVQFLFFSGYVIFAFPSSKIVERIGYKRTMITGLLVMAAGCLLFLPAAGALSFPLFLGALLVLSAGITALQVSANPYVSILGPPQTASSRLNLTQAFNSLGTTIAPYFGGFLILGAAAPKTLDQLKHMAGPAVEAYKLQQASSVKLPYILLTIVLVLLAVAIAMFKLPVISGVEDESAKEELHSGHAGSVWKQRHLILGVIGIFLYVGAEVAIGSFLVNYFTLPKIGNLTVQTAAYFVSFYWGSMMVGRFIGSALLQKLPTGAMVGTVGMAAFLLVCTSILTTGHVAMWSIILVGLFNSIMFPSIFTLGIAQLGPLTGEGSGLLIAAIVGGAIVPELEGVIADHIGIQLAFVVPALCYLYIMFYGFRGSRLSPNTPIRAVAQS